MKFIGITGGVGAGKSVVLSFLEREYNGIVLQADRIAEQLMAPGAICHRQLWEAFGDTGVFLPGQIIDRAAMARVIFSDERRRRRMNEIVHPQVKAYVKELVEREKRAKRYDFVFFEAALLIEEQYHLLCDELWYIYAEEAVRRRRLMDARGYSGEKVDAIFASQLPEKVFRQYCTRVIDNNGTPEQAFAQIRSILCEENKHE